ncbi:unnamed protein product [Peniophora sp. CBMAI 1063]|nr:unnamed protein product [Peniophora sp. CBMAI 1063]
MATDELGEVSTTAAEPSQNTAMAAVQNAGPPFDKASADVILRSADNIDYRAHRVILSIASEVFSDMFSLPAPSGHDVKISEGMDQKKDGMPVVAMAEDGRSLAMLLTFCYPIPQPTPNTIEDIVLGLRLVRKFHLAHIQKPLEMLKIMAQREPERVYAIACTFQLRDVAVSAARSALLTRDDPLLLHPEFGAISSFDLIRLRRYHVAVLSALRQTCLNLNWLAVQPSGTGCPFPIILQQPGVFKHVCASATCQFRDRPSGYRDCGEGVKIMLKPWVQTYLTATEAALAKRPVPGIASAENIKTEVYTGAAGCQSCQGQALEILPRFAASLAARLETVISQVELELPF